MQICLRTVNASKSAYLSVDLGNNFFQAYDVFNTSDLQTVVLFKVG